MPIQIAVLGYILSW